MIPTRRDEMVQQLRDEEREIQRAKKPKQPIVRLRFIVLLLLIGAALPLATIGWKDLYSGFLEKGDPIIELVEVPRGIGLTPVTLRMKISDDGSGLADVIVRVRQRGNIKEIFREKLEGKRQKELVLEFTGDRSIFDEGQAEIEVRAFDRSLWSNRAEQIIPLLVDYRRPRVEVITSQHNARQGGSQLVFYRAFDDNLSVSGVKVGNQTFLGYPAKGIDREIDDPNLYVAIYVTELDRDPEKLQIRLFAEDKVGNAASISFYNRVAKRTLRNVSVNVSERFLREDVASMADIYYPQLQGRLLAEGRDIIIDAPPGTERRSFQQFQFMISGLRPYNNNQIASFLREPRFEKLWDGPFQRQSGSIRFSFGDLIRFKSNKEPIGELLHLGYEFDMPRDNRDVVAANDGIVSFVETVGVFARTVGIDHGLGLMSIYANLESATVQRGDRVVRGAKIGVAERGGLMGVAHTYFEMRASGVPFDPGEWMDRNWYQGHVTAKVNEIRSILGLQVYRRLD